MSKVVDRHVRTGEFGRVLNPESHIDSSGYVPLARRVEMMIAAGREMQGNPQFYDFVNGSKIPSDFSLSTFRPLRKPNLDLTDVKAASASLQQSLSVLEKVNADTIQARKEAETKAKIIAEYEALKASQASVPPVNPVPVS